MPFDVLHLSHILTLPKIQPFTRERVLNCNLFCLIALLIYITVYSNCQVQILWELNPCSGSYQSSAQNSRLHLELLLALFSLGKFQI